MGDVCPVIGIEGSSWCMLSLLKLTLTAGTVLEGAAAIKVRFITNDKIRKCVRIPRENCSPTEAVFCYMLSFLVLAQEIDNEMGML
jgi:hypothetical protein